ncbi:hypothetical protein SBRCBS47491_002286 [Sporothrix bragantina]|uniref:Proteophosphoglycan ppg4 n=1 Tax=Sporothrix bragantina TaxID=671064 RepID=A0ABP0B5K6_9PEZI
MAPLALPPLKPRSRGEGGSGAGSSYSSHLPVVPPRSAPHGDTVSLFSVRSMNSTATSTGAIGQNNVRDDSSSMYSERRVPTGTAKHSPSLPSLSSFAASSSRLKPAAAAPGKAVRKFMRMAGKAASSAKGAIKGPVHAHGNDSTPSISAHSSGGTPSITVTTPVLSPMLSPAPSPRPPHSPLEASTIPTVRPTMVARRRSMSKISQLTGLDVGAATGGSSSGISTAGFLRRTQSTDTAGRGHLANISTSSASTSSNIPTSAVLSPASTTATSPSVWNTSMFNSDDENDEDENEDTYIAEDHGGEDEDSIRSKSMSPTAATAEEAAGDMPDPAMASLLRSLSQTSTQPPPVMPRLSQLGQLASPPIPADSQRTLLPPNRLLKIKRYSDPTMAPIIEHPDDTSNPSGSSSSRASSHYSDRDRVVSIISNKDNDEDASAFIPSRPAPIPVRSPSPPPPAASPTHPSMLSLTLFPPVPTISAANIAKHIPTIRLFPSSSDNQASTTSPTSPASATSSPTVHNPPVAPLVRKNTLPTSNDISNPWPTSPPPRPPPPPPLHPITAPETEVGESTTEVAAKRFSGNGPNAALFRTVQWGDMADPSRTSTGTAATGSTVNRLSLHARTKSNGSASESIATSIATSVANSSTSGSSALSSTVASTIASSSRSAGFGSFSSASTASNRYSYQLNSPPMPPPPPPNYPLPPLPASALIPVPMSMSMSMPVAMPAATPAPVVAPPPPTQSAFDEDDEEISARMMAARMMKKAASRDSVRWRPTALGKSLFRREGSPGPAGSSEIKSTSTPGLRSSLSTRSSLSATTLLAAQRVSQAARKTVEAVSEGGSGSNSAARQHELEMEKWREDLRSRIRIIPEGGEVTAEEAASQVIGQVTVQQPAPPAATTTPQPKAAVRTSTYEIRPASIYEVDDGGMI